ncbi:DUF523 and DUF1722 domain-containing protein [Simiduia litorea]|uniref:YbgA family protein n=1 Tax=Simiduia litorea TaxID=1435348 RepID=UPI0036F39010
MSGKLKVGVSACLMGQKVRFNAGHKRSDFCERVLATQADFVPICPEVAIGLPVPRPAIRLVRSEDLIKVVPSQDPSADVDYADALTQIGRDFMQRHPDLDGFVFMNDSPSCGPANVKTYRTNGYQADKNGVGLFALAVQKANPLLPFEDAGRLNDLVIRENFMVRLNIYREWRLLNNEALTMGKLIEFYSPYKYQLMAHSQPHYRAVGKLLANHDKLPVDEVAVKFIALLMEGLKKLADRKSHSNVLLHLLGYFKRFVDAEDRQELLAAIDQYRLGVTPLVAPLTLFKHHLKRSRDDYLRNQTYWSPHAPELGLRSFI